VSWKVDASARVVPGATAVRATTALARAHACSSAREPGQKLEALSAHAAACRGAHAGAAAACATRRAAGASARSGSAARMAADADADASDVSALDATRCSSRRSRIQRIRHGLCRRRLLAAAERGSRLIDAAGGLLPAAVRVRAQRNA
jgi:hypothetical protein